MHSCRSVILQELLYNNSVLVNKKFNNQDLLRDDCPEFVVFLISSASTGKCESGTENWEIF
jgi:hypothetical protein